jgi:hypothetical protein
VQSRTARGKRAQLAPPRVRKRTILAEKEEEEEEEEDYEEDKEQEQEKE